MRIGEMVSNMMMVSRNKEMFANKLHKANMEMATGKRVNSASDDPSSIGRIERNKAQLNESKLKQSAIGEQQNRNTMMEASLDAMSEANSQLSSLAQELSITGADSTTIEAQAKSLLESMAKSFEDTEYNGVNPFESDGAPAFKIAVNETDSNTFDITLNDGTTLSGQSVTDILDSDFIAENLTSQLAGAKSTIGTQNNILEFQANFEKTKEEVLTKSLSNIEDADLDKSAIDAAIASQMIQSNQRLLSTSINNATSQIGSMFDVRI